MRSAFAECERSLALGVVTAVCSIFIKQELDEPWELSMSGGALNVIGSMKSAILLG